VPAYAYPEITLQDNRKTSFSYVYEQIDCRPTGEMVIGVSFLFADDSIMQVYK
jgi:hypothetical protein